MCPNFPGTFCDNPPVPPAASDMSIITWSWIDSSWDSTTNPYKNVPFDNTVTYQCNQFGGSQSDFWTRTINITCLQDGSYTTPEWLTCLRSMYQK